MSTESKTEPHTASLKRMVSLRFTRAEAAYLYRIAASYSTDPDKHCSPPERSALRKLVAAGKAAINQSMANVAVSEPEDSAKK